MFVDLQKCKRKKKSCCSFLGNTYRGKSNEFTHGRGNACQGSGNGDTMILCSSVFPHLSSSLQFIRDDLSGILMT